MQRFLTILAFYRPFVVWSFAVNVIMGFFNPHLVPVIVTKLFLTVFAWYYVSETNVKRKLIFYKNLGISTFKLFSSLFLVDIILTISFLIVFKEFT